MINLLGQDHERSASLQSSLPPYYQSFHYKGSRMGRLGIMFLHPEKHSGEKNEGLRENWEEEGEG